MNPFSKARSHKDVGGSSVTAKFADPYKWTVDDVGIFLDSLEMGTYKKGFKSQEINGEALMELNEADLLALKLTSPSERAKLIMAISQIKAKFGRQQDGVAEDDSSTSCSASTETSGQSATSGSKIAEVQFKCTYGEETRVLKAQSNVIFDKFSRKIRSAFGHRMNIKYTDKAGDLISVKSEEEFRLMMADNKDSPVIRIALSRKRRTEEVNNSETAILETMINPRGIIQFVNTATTRIFGYSNQNVKMVMPSSIAERHDGFLAEYLRTGIAHIIGKGRIVEGRRKDGSIVSLDLAVSHTRNKKRDIFTGTFSEVANTTRKNIAESDISAAGLSSGFALLENLLFAAIVADHKGQILFANAHAAKLLGYEKNALVGKNVRVLMPNPDSGNHDVYMRNYLESRIPKVIGRARDVVGMMKDGSLVPLNLTISEQIMGNQSLFTAILRPLSDEVRQDTKSVMQAERDMLATLAVAAVMIDERGSIQGFNAAAETLWGYKLAEVVGRNVKMLMPNPERDRHDGYIKRYLESGKQRVFGMGRDVTAVHKDGSMLAVRLSVSEKKDDSKRIWTAIVQKLN